jgi:hypothetical protein
MEKNSPPCGRHAYHGRVEKVYLPRLDEGVVRHFSGTHILLVNLGLRLEVGISGGIAETTSSPEKNVGTRGLRK